MLEKMTIALLELRNGHLSLEFEKDGIPEVVNKIRNLFGKADQMQYVVASEVTFGGATFTF